MKKSILTILTFLFCLAAFGQIGDECFVEIKKQRKEEMERLQLGKKWVPNLDSLNKNITTTDWDSLSTIEKRTLMRVTNCNYPTSYLRTSENKEINTNKIKTKFTLINFNYLYCDRCIQQLDDFLQIKKEMKDQVTVLVFFPENQKDIQHIIDKYKTYFEFIPDKKKYIEDYNLGLGTPFNLVLDKNKKVKYATNGANDKSGLLYKELIPYLK